MKPDRLLQALADSGVDFVIVGGFAGVVHGAAILTNDLDVCAPLDEASVANLRVALAPFQPVHRMTPKRLSFLEVPKSLDGLNNLYLDTDLGPVDILTEIAGVGGVDEIGPRAVEVQLFGISCKVIHIDDLIDAKLALGREKDLAAVRELKVIRERP